MMTNVGRPPRALTLARVLMHAAIGLAAAVAICVAAPLIGGNIKLAAALANAPWDSAMNPDAMIFWSTRIPRVLLGLIVGGSLALSGLIFQAILRNPLAEPYILGISGGAALGRMIATIIAFGGQVVFFFLAPFACFAGALVPMLILMTLAARSRSVSTVTILLGGVILNVFFSALILLLQYFADLAQVRQMFLWCMGALDIVGYTQIAVVLPIALAAFIVVACHARAMNLLSLDDGTATHLGVNVRRGVNTLLWTGSILTAAMVAVSGPIGFVGLIVPHSLRLIFGSDNRLLGPLSLIYGGVFLVVCDFIGWRGMELMQAAGMPLAQTSEIPVGVITAILGGPFFLYLLITRQK
ncbi:MAG: iron ABC transporter permease [bacterium]